MPSDKILAAIAASCFFSTQFTEKSEKKNKGTIRHPSETFGCSNWAPERSSSKPTWREGFIGLEGFYRVERVWKL